MDVPLEFTYAIELAAAGVLEQGGKLLALARSRRKYWLPRLDIPPRRGLPPVEFCRGTRPSQAANSRGPAYKGCIHRAESRLQFARRCCRRHPMIDCQDLLAPALAQPIGNHPQDC